MAEEGEEADDDERQGDQTAEGENRGSQGGRNANAASEIDDLMYIYAYHHSRVLDKTTGGQKTGGVGAMGQQPLPISGHRLQGKRVPKSWQPPQVL